MELEILLARAQAWALDVNGQVDEAEFYLRRALELGSQRGEERTILDLRLGQDDYGGVRQRLIEFRDRLTPQKFRLYETVSLAFEGQVSAETSICLEELPDHELFGRAILAHALGLADAPQLLQEAFAAKNTEWKQRKLEELLLQRQGVSACSLCELEPATRLWFGEKPICVACARRVDKPNTLLQAFMEDETPESLRLKAWLGEPDPEQLKELQEMLDDLPPGAWVDGEFQPEMEERPSNGILLQMLSEQQLLEALPSEFRDKLVRPLSPGKLVQALMDEPSAEVKNWLSAEQFSSLSQEAESWPSGEAAAFWVLQTAQWSSMLDSREPAEKIHLADLWASVQLQSPEHSSLAPNCSVVCDRVCRSGLSLADESLELLEPLLADRPCDLFLRCLLLGAYPYGDVRNQEHGVWFIRNRPKLGFTCDPPRMNSFNSKFQAAAVNAWAEQILANRDDTAILGHAGQFFSYHNRELAEALYSRCLELEPQNPNWYRDLAGVIERTSNERESKARALRLMEQSLELEEEEFSKQHLRTQMVGLAVEAGEDQKARIWAQELIDQVDSLIFQGDALHQSHLALCRLALNAGNTAEAESHLLKAGQVPTSPVLGSFGPSMLLAQELLKQGSSQTVLDYLELCKKFWDSGLGELDKWIEAIHRGDLPDFGSNLNY